MDRRWHPIDDGVLPYLLALMRSLWVWPLLYLWSNFLTPGVDDLVAGRPSSACWPAHGGRAVRDVSHAQPSAARWQSSVTGGWSPPVASRP